MRFAVDVGSEIRQEADSRALRVVASRITDKRRALVKRREMGEAGRRLEEAFHKPEFQMR